MKRMRFLCTLQSDVVIHADANTEGNIPVHDYIPGSNFLGVVAKEYESFGEKSFDVFHSGRVRFGDAHPMLEGSYALRPPLSWFYQKGKEVQDGLFNQLRFGDEELRSLVGEGIQLKQLRGGFFFGENYTSLSHRYAQKSAYDSDKRRSKEGEMYGYSALPGGLRMIFEIAYDDTKIDPETIEKIRALLIGERSIGKSRSAQYGAVRIEPYGEELPPERMLPAGGGELYIYARSRLALVDEAGNPTFQPTVKGLGLPGEARIDWGRSHIRTALFAPYNAARRGRDYQRFVIDKGSVIVVSGLPDGFDAREWLRSQGDALGIYRSEGFGSVLLDPDFLGQKKFTLKKTDPQTAKRKPRSSDNRLFDWIKRQSQKKKDELHLIDKVKKFIDQRGKEFLGTNPSQWGALRAFARAGYKEKKIKEYLEKGTASKEQWNERRKKLLFKALNKAIDKESFLRLLSAEMAKYIRRERGES